MIQSSTANTEHFEEMVARLVEKFHPTRVWLFGSRARGDARPDSDYDFFVESQERPDGMMILSDGMTWLDDFPDIKVHVHLSSLEVFEHRQNDPGRIDWDVAREGKLVYPESRNFFLTPAPARLVKELSPEPPPSLPKWITSAERDMRAATQLSSEFAEFGEIICFHSQQAAEKFLKALIISRHRHPARTHELHDLLTHIRNIGIALDDLDEDCTFLTPFAVEARYPYNSVTAGDARRALEAAERIALAVRSRLR